MLHLLISLLLLSNNIWLNNIDTAKKKASEQNQYILINFSGSDWCIPCIKMRKEIFDHPDFTNYAQDHLILLNADFPQTKKNKQSPEQKKMNEALADQYNSKGIFPLTILINPKGEIIKKWEGYHSESIQSFMQTLQEFDYHGK